MHGPNPIENLLDRIDSALTANWRWLPLLIAIAVGVARVYFGEHNPLDVVAGACLGTALAMLSRAFVLDAGEAGTAMAL